MFINKKSILIISLFIILFSSLHLSAVNSSQTKAMTEYPLSEFTHQLSQEEEALMPFWGKDREKSTPPLTPVRPVAEFEPLTAVLVRYPLGFQTNIIKQMAEELTVITIVASESVKNQAISAYTSAQVNMENCKFMIGATNSYWTRDYGPWFAFNGNNELSVIDFTYNRPRPLDDALIPIYAQYDTLNCYTMTISQTGGNYMTDGLGIAASTEIAYTENGNNSTNVNQQMLDYMGVTNYQVLPDPNNTYIDHIDCWGKFLAPDKVLIRSVPTSHAQYDEIEATASYFANLMSSYNRPFRVYRVNTPNNQPYTNSVILNNRVFVPIMNNTNDAAALQVYRDAMPGYQIIGVLNTTSNPWESTDALHCRTHEIPDRRVLYIAHTPLPINQELLESYPIVANITSFSNGTINTDSTKVYFKVNQGDYTTTDLNFITDNQYRANIPAAAPGDTIYYYIHAVDSNSKKNNHPLIGAPDPHYFVIANDTQAPVITHTAVPSVSMNDFPLNITATISDNSLVSSVYLDYFTNTSTDTLHISMTETEENIWSCQLQPSTEGLMDIYYRIRAIDNANPANIAYAPTENTWYHVVLTNAIDENTLPVSKDSFISVYPNPVNFSQSNINLKFSTISNKQVTFELFNIKGQKVYEIKQFNRKSNINDIQFNINDHIKTSLNSGIYFIKMKTDKASITKKVIIIK